MFIFPLMSYLGGSSDENMNRMASWVSFIQVLSTIFLHFDFVCLFDFTGVIVLAIVNGFLLGLDGKRKKDCLNKQSMSFLLMVIYSYKNFNNSKQRGGLVMAFWDDSENSVQQAFLRMSLLSGSEGYPILWICAFNVLEIISLMN